MKNNPYKECNLCPRLCGVNRTEAERGYCRETADCRISSIGPHFGEEPSFSGTRGSGTVFFSGCSCRCFFCQNYQISLNNDGYNITNDELFEQLLALAQSSVHNLNFVTPDHFWPHIQEVCTRLRKEGVTIPFLFNCSGYQLPAMIDEYVEHMDIFMPDFKFADPELAKTCMQDEHYPEIALQAIRHMIEHKGFLTPWDPLGKKTAIQGVLIRHLVMPGAIDNSLTVLEFLYREFGSTIPLSIMSQFHPVPNCHAKGLFKQRLRSNEYQQVLDKIEELGFDHAYIQPDMGDPNFLPDFDEEEPFRGNKKE